mmetsp:Transcript_30968/g.62980  ORF Transcript_30968/g.62980 Transcript_30968/m.62980 type:complete len:1502 (+) Transcript_30968:105-4610(+)
MKGNGKKGKSPNETINLAPRATSYDDDDDDYNDDGDCNGDGDGYLGHRIDDEYVGGDAVSNLQLVSRLSFEDGGRRGLRRNGSGSPSNLHGPHLPHLGSHSGSFDGSAHSHSNGGRTGSHGSVGNHGHGNHGHDPGGSADTRRRITKLSKARAREKVPRLVEYFCVVSSRPKRGTAEAVSEAGEDANDAASDDAPVDVSEFQPEITARYPLEDHEENPLLADSVTAFCFPSGTIPLVRRERGVGPPMPKVHYFVTTSEKGQSMYGTCLTVWEAHEVEVEVEVEVVVAAQAQAQVSSREASDVSNSDDAAAAAAAEARAAARAKRAMEAPVYNKHDFLLTPTKAQPKTQPKVTDKVTDKAQPKPPSASTSASTSAPTRHMRKQIVYLPKCLVILSMHPYLVAFREYLTQLHRLSKTPPPNNHSSAAPNEIILDSHSHASKTALTLPIERYITNFCSELPAPPPGSFQVQTTILDSVISIWSPPHNMPIAWVSLPFAHLFQCLDIPNILTVWAALALERQVLVTSTQLSLLATCCEILLSLLFPMKWSHAYIPVLPHFLVPILSAPMPFLCGIDKRHLADTLEDLSAECIVVDLDKNQLSLGVNTPPLPSLPRHVRDKLHRRLEDNVGYVHREVRSLRKHDDTSEMGFHLPPEVKSMADALWESRLCLFDEAFLLAFTPEQRRKNCLNGDDEAGLAIHGDADDPNDVPVRIATWNDARNRRSQSRWDAVQEAFLETYCHLLQRYRKYLVFPSKQNEGAYGGAGFRAQEFLAGQRADAREFLEELVGSQMFDDFVTKRLYGSGESDIGFFDGAVDRYVRNQSFIASIGRNVGTGGGGGGGSGVGRGEGGRGSVRPGARIRKMFGAASSGSSSSSSGGRNKDKEPPLLQSARVKHKLKTIVPPEPSGDGLPDRPVENATVVRVLPKTEEAKDGYLGGGIGGGGDDDVDHDEFPRILHSPSDAASIASASTSASRANKAGKGRVYYHYPTFPERLDPELFGTPRPMSSAVLAEFDRQRENAGKFRRMSSSKELEDAGGSAAQNARRNNTITGQLGPVEKPATSEVTTFTVFFMAFTAVVGKDLMAMSNDSLSQMDDQTILSTYTDRRTEKQKESEQIANFVDEIVMDADLPPSPSRERKQRQMHSPPKETQVRNRFNDKLSTLKIMEAKETARAELGIAFEMLKMMKERALRADPEAYQCLIDACGRCGDTDRATELLSRMHEDGIVADGVVYSSLVAAFSAENAWKQASGEAREELPEWAKGASLDMDWNTLKNQKRSYIDIVKERLGGDDNAQEEHPVGLRNTFKRIIRRQSTNQAAKKNNTNNQNGYTEQYVTDQVLRQILLGENLLEIVYPDISIDTDNEFCPRCNFYLSDDDVVAGWSAGNSQEYKTECPNCLTKFVPHFCVQSTLPSFAGSRGPNSPLFCERLSPWVLKKELRSVISGGIEDLLSPEWREKESKNAVLWWNLILSFMRYRFPFTFLLQGSFGTSLIAPTPDADEDMASSS